MFSEDSFTRYNTKGSPSNTAAVFLGFLLSTSCKSFLKANFIKTDDW